MKSKRMQAITTLNIKVLFMLTEENQEKSLTLPLSIL